MIVIKAMRRSNGPGQLLAYVCGRAGPSLKLSKPETVCRLYGT